MSLLIIPAANHIYTPLPRYLLTLNGETLISRLIRQFNTDDLIIMSTHPKITELYDGYVYMPEESGCLCESLVNTYHLWHGKTYIVPGDVYLTDSAVKQITLNRDKCIFWGNSSGILSLSFYEAEATQLMLSMWAAVMDWQNRKSRGLLEDAHAIYSGGESYAFRSIEDECRDFDSFQEYELFIAQGDYDESDI